MRRSNNPSRGFSGVVAVLFIVLGFFLAVYNLRLADYLFIAFFLLLGFYHLIHFGMAPERGPLPIVLGFADILFAGLAALCWFDIIEWDLAMGLVPVWGLVEGTLQLLRCFVGDTRRYGGQGWALLAAVVCIISGLVLLIFPGLGWLTMSTFIGILLGLMVLVTGTAVLADAFE